MRNVVRLRWKILEFVTIAAIALLGWQVGVFACTCLNPISPDPARGETDCCQGPHCHDYEHVCPSGWIKFPPSDPYPCCRTYTGSGALFNDPPCCQWIRPYQPGCDHFGCYYPAPPPNARMVIHCKRWNTERRGNWKDQDIWICEGQAAQCSEKMGTCNPL